MSAPRNAVMSRNVMNGHANGNDVLPEIAGAHKEDTRTKEALVRDTLRIISTPLRRRREQQGQQRGQGQEVEDEAAAELRVAGGHAS